MEGKKLMFLLLLVASSIASPIQRVSDSVVSPKVKEAPLQKAVPQETAVQEDRLTNETEETSTIRAVEVKESERDAEKEELTDIELQAESSKVTEPTVIENENGISAADISEISSVKDSQDEEDVSESQAESTTPVPVEEEREEDSVVRQDSMGPEDLTTELPAQEEKVRVSFRSASQVADRREQKQEPAGKTSANLETTEIAPVEREEDLETTTETADIREEATTEIVIDETPDEVFSSHSLFRSENVDEEQDSTTLSPASDSEDQVNEEDRDGSQIRVEENDSTTVLPEKEDAKKLQAQASMTQETKISLKDDEAATAEQDQNEQDTDSTTLSPDQDELRAEDEDTEFPVTEEDVHFKFAAPIQIIEVGSSGNSDVQVTLPDSAPIEVVEITDRPESERDEGKLGAAETKPVTLPAEIKPSTNETSDPKADAGQKVVIKDDSEASDDQAADEAITEASPSSDAEETEIESEGDKEPTSDLPAEEENKPISSKKQPANEVPYWLAMRQTITAQEDSPVPSVPSAINEEPAGEAEATTDEPSVVEREEASVPAAEEGAKTEKPVALSSEKPLIETSLQTKLLKPKPSEEKFAKPTIKDSGRLSKDPLLEGSQVLFQESNSLQRRLA